MYLLFIHPPIRVAVATRQAEKLEHLFFQLLKCIYTTFLNRINWLFPKQNSESFVPREPHSITYRQRNQPLVSVISIFGSSPKSWDRRWGYRNEDWPGPWMLYFPALSLPQKSRSQPYIFFYMSSNSIHIFEVSNLEVLIVIPIHISALQFTSDVTRIT